MIDNVSCIQYSQTNLTIIIPEDIKLNIDTDIKGLITYDYLLRDEISSKIFECDWNPCHNATFYTMNNKKIECTYRINNVVYYYKSDSPAYNNMHEEYYKPKIIAMSVLWSFSIPFIILVCIFIILMRAK